MKRLMSIMGGLLSLLALGALAVALALTFGGMGRKAEPASQAFQSPIETPTQLPYPIPATPIRPSIPTIPPTVTRAPKPTPIPTPTPTVTPIPTPLPLPPSAFYALWAENYPEGQGSTLWLADPRDIGSRKELLRFERDAIAEAALSPDGRKLALVTRYWKTAVLWVANVDGTGLQQLDQAAALGGLVWSRDSRSRAYGIGWREEVMMPSVKTGTPEPVPVWRGAVELVDVTTGKKERLLEIAPDSSLSVLGWSADGQELYYSQLVSKETGKGYELWALNSKTRNPREIALLGTEPVSLILAPDGSKFLVGVPEGLTWMSADGQIQQAIVQPQQGFSAIWAPNGRDLVVSYWDPNRSQVVVQSIDVQSRTPQNLGVIGQPGEWRLLAISPDYHWLAAFHYYTGLYWIHLLSGMRVPVPSPDRGSVFHVAWVPGAERK